MIRTRCPTCDEEVVAEDLRTSPTYSFCSERCRMADLDRWFTEDYAIPGEDAGGGGPRPGGREKR